MKNFILDSVEKTIKKSEKIYSRRFDRIPIKFNLKGSTAGQYCYIKGSNSSNGSYFRFNLDIAIENGKSSYKSTVIHEVAHHISRVMAEGKYIKPHGVEWKRVMSDLGLNPVRCHSYTVPEKTRRLKYFDYECDCQTHNVSSIIHNRMLKGQKRFCKKCKSNLRRKK